MSEKQLKLTDKDNPYEVISILNNKLQQANQHLEEYRIAFESLQHERNIAVNQVSRLQNRIQDLTWQLKNQIQTKKENQLHLEDVKAKLKFKSQIPTKIQSSIYKKNVPAFKSQYIPISPLPPSTKSNIFQSLNKTQHPKQAQNQEAEFIPPPLRFSEKNYPQSNIKNSQSGHSEGPYLIGDNLIQDFYVIGPQTSEFKQKRSQEKDKNILWVKSGVIYNVNKFYKTRKMQYVNEIGKRAFPMGCKLTKHLIDRSEDLYNLLQFKPQFKVSEDYFIFTLKGDQALDLKQKKKSIINHCNPNKFLCLVCLKIPDFIYLRDEKHYHRREHEIWVTEKIYVISTYYTFFPIIISLLAKIQGIMRQNCINKVLIQGQNPLLWGLSRNSFDLEKNQQIKDLLNYFSTKKPEYNQICSYSKFYFGSTPEIGFKAQYAIALMACPIFFTSFSYEEMLLLITAIFCQKTLIFMSKSQSVATLCALFLINVISPFKYSEPLLLNCDYEKIRSMIFQFPFAMICSIKKTPDNLEEILSLFSESNVMRSIESDAQHILIDIDSNTILYENVLNSLFENCVVSPNEKLKKSYYSINPSSSKSFSLPKTLPREDVRKVDKPRSQIEKKQYQKKKNVKDYMQRINNNITKLPSFRYAPEHEFLLKLLIQYIQGYTLEQEFAWEMVKQKSKNLRNDNVYRYLTERNRNQSNLIAQFLNSQMYANYLDSFLEQKIR